MWGQIAEHAGRYTKRGKKFSDGMFDASSATDESLVLRQESHPLDLADVRSLGVCTLRLVKEPECRN